MQTRAVGNSVTRKDGIGKATERAEAEPEPRLMQSFCQHALALTFSLGIGACGDTPTDSIDLIEPAQPTQVTLKSCRGTLPWVGYKDGNGSWVKVEGVPAGEDYTYTFTLNQRVAGVAYVVTTTCGRLTWVDYATAAELASSYLSDCGTFANNTKTLHGTVAGGLAGQYSAVSLGNSFEQIFGESGDFTLENVADGPRDLVAYRGNFGGADKLIVRRGVNLPSGATIPVLNFAGPEAFGYDSAQLSLQQFVAPGFVSSTIYLASGGFMSGSAGPASATAWYRGLPASATIAGDKHGVGVTSAGRSVSTVVGPLANLSLSFGPVATTPAIAELSTGAPLRRRLTIPVQSQYSKAAHARFETGTRPYYYLNMTMTAAYRGNATSWVFEVPDFGASSGYDAAWALQPSSRQLWSSTVYDYDLLETFVPTVGATRRSATASNATALPSSLPSLDQAGPRQLMLPTSINSRYEQQSCSL